MYLIEYRKILFVCTGNSCRSPMAEALARCMVEKDAKLLHCGIEVKSAGTTDFGNHEATYATRQVMLERGLDLSRHTPQHINEDLAAWADLILVMEHEHKKYLQINFPHVDGKVYLLSEFAGEEGEIDDPLAAGIETYRKCCARIESLVTRVMDRIRWCLIF